MIYIVLAAGTSQRMGFAKVFEPLHGVSPLARIGRALDGRRSVIVTSSARTADARALVPSAQIAINDEPERGMTHSLRCGLRAVPEDAAFGVILGDMPYLNGALLDALEGRFDDETDVLFPVYRDVRPGHPVLFSARVRAIVEALPDGDTLRSARDRTGLRRITVAIDDPGAFLDLDNPEQWSAADA